ncbi:MAG: tRNA 2-selenouridine(34) synthase MnmH [Rikenellaceae bacterium]
MKRDLSVEDFLGNPNALIIDVRTPAEYALGHIRGAYNMPIFENDERAEVGTIYKKISRNRAVERGLEIVGGKLARFVREAREVAQGRDIYLYCWRGGMRSGSMQWLLSTAGLKVSLLKGGYKRFRSDFESQLDKPWKFMTLGGRTGCGKSDILREIEAQGEQMLDLEALANHKGSAFGGMGLGEQPTTEEFINRIHYKLRSFDPSRVIWCEGESILIGHVYIPERLFKMLGSSPSINFDLDLECRIERLVAEYGGFEMEDLSTAFLRIRKRLGNDNLKLAQEALKVGDVATAARIALIYYDKSYAHSGGRREGERLEPIFSERDDPRQSAQRLIEIYYSHFKK